MLEHQSFQNLLTGPPGGFLIYLRTKRPLRWESHPVPDRAIDTDGSLLTAGKMAEVEGVAPPIAGSEPAVLLLH